MAEEHFARTISEKIVELNKMVMEQVAARGTVNPELVTLAADLRTYFVHQVLDCPREGVLGLSLLLDTLGNLAQFEEDPFDAGFLTSLSQVVTVRHEKEENRERWQHRFQQAVARLGIGPV